jgi:hypothetical protein
VKGKQAESGALTGRLRKVSVELEMRESAPQTVCLPAVASREGGNDQ